MHAAARDTLALGGEALQRGGSLSERFKPGPKAQMFCIGSLAMMLRLGAPFRKRGFSEAWFPTELRLSESAEVSSSTSLPRFAAFGPRQCRATGAVTTSGRGDERDAFRFSAADGPSGAPPCRASMIAVGVAPKYDPPR